MIILRPHQLACVKRLSRESKGIVVMPTGSGKTITMIQDCINRNVDTVVVVAPTIVLCNQLSREFMEFIDNRRVCIVHSGDTQHFTTTNPQDIRKWYGIGGKKIIFTTYHSLNRVQLAGIRVDSIYFDESHNSVKSNFHVAVKYFADVVKQGCYFFTASPKYSYVDDKPGMNDKDVYGNIIYTTPVTEMIESGYIVPPSLKVIESEKVVDGKYSLECDIGALIKSIEDNELNNVMVSCKNTTQLYHISHSHQFISYCVDNKFTIYTISSKYGCFIDDKKVRRDMMMKDMKNNVGKFIVFHVEILCEGINLPNLDGLVLLKRLSTIRFVQSIGRILRLSEGKTEGKVVLPLYSKYLKKTHKSVMNLMNSIYNEGNIPIEGIRR